MLKSYIKTPNAELIQVSPVYSYLVLV